ncbi:hypothetical protein D9611_004760 [Ephemerocybe angulata]|uniref:Actin cytoskeleton organization protein n=1 Tax=Ephemerocybe angulata TaxID=980116 RepID=A0A8H5B359_9AGAR|nr:hypothetical protein D9611_004760 [Tulosesus angulatus]
MSSAALERQMRPVYDALDTGSNKSAVVACDKLLKKHPKNVLLKSLKALALVRQQKIEESLTLCDEVLATKPVDDAILTAMMHVLRGLGRYNDVICMFEEAYKRQPTNEEYGAQTFFANIRAGNWKSAQQIATRMHKQFQEDRYLYWSVISAVLQADDPGTPAAMRTILYKLAHRLIESSPTPSYVGAERFYLHLLVIRELKLNEEADKLLNSDIGQKICAVSLACDELRRKIWGDRGMAAEEGVHAEKRIVEKSDRNWLEFLSVLDATFTGSDISASVQKSRELFEQVATKDGSRDRSGLLALLELERRAKEAGVSSEPSRINELLEKYFAVVGDKACCFEDLKPYVILEDEQRSRWTTFLEQLHISLATTKELQKAINVHKLLRFSLLPSEITTESENKRLEIYTKLYHEALPLGSALAVTELQPADDFALLAGNTYINLWDLSHEYNYLYSAASFLEFALSKSKQSFLTRLILIRIYRLIGAPSLALEHYRALSIKQVQHDTLSHLVLSRASTFSLASVGDITYSTECIEASQIYLSNSQETPEFVMRAFTSEKYSQIPEFITFENRLENSLQRDNVKMEHLRMRLTHEPIASDLIDMELIELKFIFDKIHHDNRDFEIFPNYQPRETQGINQQTLLFGKSEGLGWLSVFLKVYIRAFQQASDLDDTVEDKLLIGDRPKQTGSFDRSLSLRDRLVERSEDDISELTDDEQKFVEFTTGVANWLEPYHDHARPPPSVVLAEAAKQTELKTGHPLKGIELPPANGNAIPKKDAPAVTEPPEVITKYFETVQRRFEDLKDAPLVNILHVATLAQEAFLLFVVETNRFKTPSIVKVNKLGALVNSFKSIRADAVSVLKHLSTELLKIAQSEAANRPAVASACALVPAAQIDSDFTNGVARKVVESRKKVAEGLGKGIAKILTTYAT